MSARHFVTDGYLTFLSNVNSDELVYAGAHFVSIGSRKYFYVYYYTAFAVRNSERSISDFPRLFAEYGSKQSLLGSKFGLALRRNLTYQYIAGIDLGADTYNTVFVEVFERIVTDVGNISGYFLFAELSVSSFGFVLFDVNGSKHVVFNDLFADKYSVLVVITFPQHETY